MIPTPLAVPEGAGDAEPVLGLKRGSRRACIDGSINLIYDSYKEMCLAVAATVHPTIRRNTARSCPICEVNIMADYQHGYVRYQNHEYKVTWHPISKEVYVFWGTDRYAGKAYDLQEALDIALSWLNNHAR